MKKTFYRHITGRPARFPKEDVHACMHKTLDPLQFSNYSRCPQCKLPPEELTWIEFISPPWTWKARCGRQGPLSLCPVCGIQVEIIVKKLN